MMLDSLSTDIFRESPRSAIRRSVGSYADSGTVPEYEDRRSISTTSQYIWLCLGDESCGNAYIVIYYTNLIDYHYSHECSKHNENS